MLLLSFFTDNCHLSGVSTQATASYRHDFSAAEYSNIPIIMLVGELGINRVEKVKYQNPDNKFNHLQIGEGIVSLMALGIPSVKRIVPYKHFSKAVNDVIKLIYEYPF